MHPFLFSTTDVWQCLKIGNMFSLWHSICMEVNMVIDEEEDTEEEDWDEEEDFEEEEW